MKSKVSINDFIQRFFMNPPYATSGTFKFDLLP